jgi:hypothetical protein
VFEERKRRSSRAAQEHGLELCLATRYDRCSPSITVDAHGRIQAQADTTLASCRDRL